LDAGAETYREAILVDPRNRQIREAFDRVLRLIHQGDGARDKILEAYKNFSDQYPYSSEIRRIYAEQLLNAGDREGAIREFRRIVEADEENPEAHLNLGKLLIGFGRQDDAIRELLRAHELAPENSEILSLLGNSLLTVGRGSEAMDLFRKALRDTPDNPDLQLGMAAVMIEGRDADGAMELLNAALPKLGTDAKRLAQAGQLLLRARNAPRAAQVLAKATAANPTEPSILGLAIRGHIRSNRPEEAVALVDRARAARIPVAPEDLYVNLAEEFQAAGNMTEADRWYRKALQDAPQRIGILSRLVTLLTISNQHDAALEAINKAGIPIEESDELMQLQASVHMDRKDYPKAIALYQKLRDQSPGVFEPVAILSEAMAIAKQPEAALAELDAAEKKFGKTENVEFARAVTLVRLRRFEQAVRIFRSLAEKNGQRAADARFFLGTTLVDLKKYDDAERVYRKGLEASPDDPRLLNALGYLLVDRNIKLQEARGLLERALEAQPRAGHIIDSMAWLLYREGRFEEALDWIREAVFFSGEDSEILEHKGMILEALKRPTEAVQAYRRALTEEPIRALAKQRLEILAGKSTSSNMQRRRSDR
jgi:tetratricopeptide (TPR) repeat protein